MSRKRIVYIQYTNPAAYPPLEHSSRILADDGWDVLFLGGGALGTAGLKFPYHERIRVRQLRFQRAGWKQKLHFLAFQFWCLGWVLMRRPSWVYISDHFSCPVGRLAGFLGMSVIFHEHDTPETGVASGFMRVLFHQRKQCAKHAALCVLPNAKRGEYVMESMALARMPAVVWNCPRLEEIGPQRGSLEARSLRLLYHGSIVPDRLPTAILDAVASLPQGVSLTIVGYETVGSPGYVDLLRKRADELGLGDRLKVAGTLATREELLSICRNHDVGLALMPRSSRDLNLRNMTGASNKPFDYLACGLALLVSKLPDWEEMFVKPGYALACDPASAESMAQAIAFFAGNPERTRSMGESGRQRILRDWNYECQFQPVRERLSGHRAGDEIALEPALKSYTSESMR